MPGHLLQWPAESRVDRPCFPIVLRVSIVIIGPGYGDLLSLHTVRNQGHILAREFEMLAIEMFHRHRHSHQSRSSNKTLRMRRLELFDVSRDIQGWVAANVQVN